MSEHESSAVVCDAVIKVNAQDVGDLTEAYIARGSLSCDSCPVRGTLFGVGGTKKQAEVMATNEAIKKIKGGCENWALKKQIDGLNDDTPMPDSFLPQTVSS